MVIDWLAQLAKLHPPTAARLLHLHTETKSIGSLPTATLWDIFSDGAAAMRKLYIVVDALDEMDPLETRSCVRDLAELVGRNNSAKGLRLVATSRQNPEIQNGFKDCKVLARVELDREKIDSDIAWYCNRRLKEEGKLDDDAARENLVKELVARGNGLYLYVKLTLDEMLALVQDDSKAKAGGLHRSFDLLPNGIADMYDHLLAKHRTAAKVTLELQILVLQAVIFSTATLTLTTLANIVNMQLYGEEGLDLPLLDAKALIRRICGPLLEIKNEMVNPVHHSFTEYLTNKNDVRGAAQQYGGKHGDSFPILTKEESHRALADLCINFLNFKRFQQEGRDLRPPTTGCRVHGPAQESLRRREQWPFLKYALLNWGEHARMGDVQDEVVFAKITKHLEVEGSVLTQLRG